MAAALSVLAGSWAAATSQVGFKTQGTNMQNILEKSRKVLGKSEKNGWENQEAPWENQGKILGKNQGTC